MTIAIRDLNSLDADQVLQNLDETTARLQEDNPTLDLRRGVFHDLLVYYHAILATALQANVQDYLNGRSLVAIQADPTLSDPSLVDDVLSNFGVTRQPGRLARGEVTIILSDDTTVTIGQGSIFTGNGQTFITEETFTAKAEIDQVLATTDRLLTALQSGNFQFTIDVVAQVEGSDANLPKDTLLVPSSLPSNYVSSFAASDFQGGALAETNEQLITRLQQGIAAKAMSNRVNMSAMLRQVSEFSRVVSLSIIGFGDVEMLRDRHTIFPVSMGGRADWYVRSQEQVFRQSLQKNATLIAKDVNNRGTWQVAIGRDDAPGFFEIDHILRADATNTTGGFTITQEVRALDLTGGGFIPDVTALIEGIYSRFQTAVIQFYDDVTDVTSLLIGAQSLYNLEAKTMPQIADIQDLVSSRDVRSFAADALVKAPIPCFVQISFTIVKSSGEPDPDLDGIKNALAASVNTVGFTGQLYASRLQAVIGGFLTNDEQTGALDLFGRLRYPDQTIHFIRSAEVLTVPTAEPSMVSARTVQFFTAPEDIAITVLTAAPADL